MSQIIRKLIETIFGDGKQHGTLRQLELRGIKHAELVFALTMTACVGCRNPSRAALFPELPAADCLNRGIALFAVVASIAVSGAASAQSSLPVPDAVQPATPAPPTPPTPPTVASAWDALEPWRIDRFYLETSVYTRHHHYDPAHDDHQTLILGEWNITEQWLVGASVFDNSFGQASQYVYGGYRFRLFESLQPLYFTLSAGLVHGYKGEYQHNSGIAPAIVPSVGYCLNRLCSELVIFGTAGALVTFGVTIP